MADTNGKKRIAIVGVMAPAMVWTHASRSAGWNRYLSSCGETASSSASASRGPLKDLAHQTEAGPERHAPAPPDRDKTLPP